MLNIFDKLARHTLLFCMVLISRLKKLIFYKKLAFLCRDKGLAFFIASIKYDIGERISLLVCFSVLYLMVCDG
jgi:hypothetical protein